MNRNLRLALAFALASSAAGLGLYVGTASSADDAATSTAASDAAAPAPSEAAPSDAAAAAPDDASAPADAAPADDSGGGDAAADDAKPAAPKKPVVPRPSEIAHKAPHALLLSIWNSGKHLVAVGARGNIVVSNDGEQWAQVQSPVDAVLTSVVFADEKNGWAVGHDSAILHTADEGKTWELQSFQPDLEKPLLNLLVIDANHAFALGAYGLYMETTDAGKTWAEVEAPEIREEGLHLNCIVKLGSGEYFLVGEEGMMGVSTDAKKWERLTSPYEASLFGALPHGPKGAVVFGLRGNVFVTEDVRTGPWNPVDLKGSKASLFGGVNLPDGSVALVGADAMVFVIGTDGSVRQAKQPVKAGTFSAGTFSGAVLWKDGMLAVGEQGVTRVQLK